MKEIEDNIEMSRSVSDRKKCNVKQRIRIKNGIIEVVVAATCHSLYVYTYISVYI